MERYILLTGPFVPEVNVCLFQAGGEIGINSKPIP